MITRQTAKLHVCPRCRRTIATATPPIEADSADGSVTNEMRNKNYRASRLRRESIARTLAARNISRPAYKQMFNAADGLLYGMHGPRYEERVLDTNVTAANSKIIVLRDAILTTFNPKVQEMPEHQVDSVNIWNQLGEENGSANEKEVYDNIESLRPKDGQPVTLDDYNTLLDQLGNGFTTLQLGNYMQKFELENGTRNAPRVQPIAKIAKSQICAITPWRPGISPIQEYFDNDPYRGYSLDTRSTKQQVVIRLLLTSWGLELPELRESIGQFEVQISSEVLDLLLSGSSSVLQTLSEEVLTLDNELLEVFRSRNVIRITTTEPRAYHVGERLTELLEGGLESQKILLRTVIPSDKKIQEQVEQIFNDAALREIECLSGVAIQREKGDAIVLSSIVHDDSQKSNLNTAKRLLLTARAPVGRVKSTLACMDAPKGAFINYTNLGGLNWWGKLRSWVRLTAPIPKESEKKNVPTAVELVSIKDIKTSSPKLEIPLTKKDQEKSVRKQLWSSVYNCYLYATLGAVIHSPPNPGADTNISAHLKRQHLVTEFSTHVPNVSRLLANARIANPLHPVRELVLRFRADPFFGQEDSDRKLTLGSKISVFPLVEMVLTIQKGVVTFKHVKAIIREQKKDVMLPNLDLDVRFKTQVTSHFQNSELPVIQKFVEQCKFNIEKWNGDEMYIPSTVMLPITPNLCLGKGVGVSGMNGVEGYQSSSQSVRFMYTDYELRQTLFYNYLGWQLDYTHIDAGKAGGRRAELSLKPIKHDVLMNEEYFEQTALNLVNDVSATMKADLTVFTSINKIENGPVRYVDPSDYVIKRLHLKGDDNLETPA